MLFIGLISGDWGSTSPNLYSIYCQNILTYDSRETRDSQCEHFLVILNTPSKFSCHPLKITQLLNYNVSTSIYTIGTSSPHHASTLLRRSRLPQKQSFPTTPTSILTSCVCS
eukprot:Platyproteum_vivax@DN14588_c0_g1_i1.p1